MVAKFLIKCAIKQKSKKLHSNAVSEKDICIVPVILTNDFIS